RQLWIVGEHVQRDSSNFQENGLHQDPCVLQADGSAQLPPALGPPALEFLQSPSTASSGLSSTCVTSGFVYFFLCSCLFALFIIIAYATLQE
ncbi:MAG TPA: hypothetical protein VJ521_12775, partial [Acidobacteriota bacterium]|nr:hypothetical protein [Acidobacteriota bacterium]